MHIYHRFATIRAIAAAAAAAVAIDREIGWMGHDQTEQSISRNEKQPPGKRIIDYLLPYSTLPCTFIHIHLTWHIVSHNIVHYSNPWFA